MTETSISLLSILLGIMSAVLFAKLKPMYSLGLAGNCIVGVFGSILFVKIFGRLGHVAPNNMVLNSNINYIKLVANLIISSSGGIIGLFFIKKIKSK